MITNSLVISVTVLRSSARRLNALNIRLVSTEFLHNVIASQTPVVDGSLTELPRIARCTIQYLGCCCYCSVLDISVTVEELKGNIVKPISQVERQKLYCYRCWLDKYLVPRGQQLLLLMLNYGVC